MAPLRSPFIVPASSILFLLRGRRRCQSSTVSSPSHASISATFEDGSFRCATGSCTKRPYVRTSREINDRIRGPPRIIVGSFRRHVQRGYADITRVGAKNRAGESCRSFARVALCFWFSIRWPLFIRRYEQDSYLRFAGLAGSP